MTLLVAMAEELVGDVSRLALTLEPPGRIEFDAAGTFDICHAVALHEPRQRRCDARNQSAVEGWVDENDVECWTNFAQEF